MDFNKFIVVSAAFIALIGTVTSLDSSERIESYNIETELNNYSLNIDESNHAIDDKFQVYESFYFNKTESGSLKLSINRNQDFIDDTNYDSEHLGFYYGEYLVRSSYNLLEDEIELIFDESGEYHLLLSEEYNYYKFNDRCDLLLNPEDSFENVETCEELFLDVTLLNAIMFLTGFTLIIFLSKVLIIPKLRFYILYKDIENLTTDIKNKDSIKNQEKALTLLLKADEAALNQNIAKSKMYLKEAKDSISRTNK